MAIGQTLAGCRCASVTLPRTELASTSRKAATVCDNETVRGLSGWRRAKVSNCRVSVSPREAAARIASQRADVLLVRQPAHQSLGLAAYDHQEIVEVVRDAAGELAERLHFLRLRELRLRALERFLRVAPLGDVAGDLGEADQLALLVADGVDDDVGKKLRAVLAHAPGLRLELAGGGGGRQRAVGQASGAVLVGVEHREVPADDFLGGVAFDAFGAGVPAFHDAVRIEHDQRVIDDAGHQRAQLLLAGAQPLGGLLLGA